MFFRVWYYLCIAVAPVLFVLVFVGFLFTGQSSALAVVAVAALYVLVALGITGAILAILLLFCGLRLRCPFCGERGDFWGDKASGPCLQCEHCGLVHGTGFLKLRLVREWENGPPPETEADEPDESDED
jgi:hypothetical protein